MTMQTGIQPAGSGGGRAGRGRQLWLTMLAFCGTLLLGACVVNPVTGEKDLLLVSEAWELQVGQQQYAPLRQSQGGDYTADAAVEEYVRQVGERMAKVSDRELPYEFNVINDSTPNAWALPGGKISINRGLLVELNTEAELAAVLGHEIVHAAAKHGARGQTRGLALQTAVLTATVASSRQDYGQLVQFGSMIGAKLINSRYGRGAELESDRFGMEYMARAGYDPQGAVDLQRTFVRLSEGRRQDFISGLFASHPPSKLRVAANERTAAELGARGETGEKRYQQVMARLKRTAPAYQKYAEAQKALKEGNSRAAQSLTREALKIEPREGHFHSLMGDIAQSRKNYKAARRHYDDAIGVNGDFYYYYLARGNAWQASNDRNRARADFMRSNELLPNAAAQESLGQIALAAGDSEQARQYFAVASQAGGDAGSRARDALLAMDAPDGNAARLVSVRKQVTREGNFALLLTNKSSRAVSNITVGLQAGRNPAQTRQLGITLQPGESRVLDFGQRFSRQRIAQFKVGVVSAEIRR